MHGYAIGKLLLGKIVVAFVKFVVVVAKIVVVAGAVMRALAS